MKFIKSQDIQKYWFGDEKQYDFVLNAIAACLGNSIIFAQVHEERLTAIVVLDVTKVVMIRALIVSNEELLGSVIRLVKQKYKNKDILCELDNLSLQAFGFVEGAYLRKDHLEDSFLNESGLVERYPAKESEKKLVLSYLSQFFEAGQLYNEREVNVILKSHISFQDYVTLRRDLFDFAYLTRSEDGSSYEKIK